MRSTTSISIKDTKILDLSIKKTWQHELPSDNRKKQKHSARNRPKVHLQCTSIQFRCLMLYQGYTKTPTKSRGQFENIHRKTPSIPKSMLSLICENHKHKKEL